jgi:hypothetical protein
VAAVATGVVVSGRRHCQLPATGAARARDSVGIGSRYGRAMSTIYLDRSAMTSSDAGDRLVHLTEAGHDLVLITAGLEAGPKAAWAGTAPRLPATVPHGSWYLTADPATCRGRQAGLRTVLIGPRAGAQRPTRCDATARDLRDAVLEILRVEAMG